ncbi:MAG: RNA-directed DNA polymerase [Nitrospirae bacterium]|nr:RNA-directed DNA polymerase [Nitrospirota bacterium]
MINRENFQRWFNRDFWKAFKNRAFPIKIPQTQNEKDDLIEKVYSSISSARYAPSIPEAEIVMNKGHGVARTVPVFCIEDYCIYYFCIKELEDVLCGNRTDNTFGGWTLGGKLRQQENNEIESELTEYGRYSFNPQAWTRAFGEFNSLLFSQLDQGNYSHILQFDLSNFYDSVRLDMIERWIREEADREKGWVITLLFYLLNQWNRRNTGLHPQSVGLPQDALADCSRILSNYYLQKYDQFAAPVCAKAGALYFRYADDQMILMNDPGKIDGILLLLTRNLDRYGLRVNQKKVELWQAAELQQHRCRTIQALFAQKGDNQKPELVRKFIDAYLAMPESALEKTWNRGLPLLNRLLWANLESLPKNLFERIVIRLTSEQYLLLADQKKLGRVYELNRKRSRPIDFAKRLKHLGEKSVHNSYHHEVLAFAISIKDTKLKIFCESRLSSLEQQMNTHEIS